MYRSIRENSSEGAAVSLEEGTLELPEDEPLVENERDLPCHMVEDQAFRLRTWLTMYVPMRNLDTTEKIYH